MSITALFAIVTQQAFAYQSITSHACILPLYFATQAD